VGWARVAFSLKRMVLVFCAIVYAIFSGMIKKKRGCPKKTASFLDTLNIRNSLRLCFSAAHCDEGNRNGAHCQEEQVIDRVHVYALRCV